MGKNYFTLEQVEELRKNKYVKHVSEKSITYTEEFKEIFMFAYNEGKLPSQLLTEMGFDYKVLGNSRIKNISDCYKHQAKRLEGFKDTRTTECGRPRTKDLSQDELIKRLQNQIE